MKSKNEIFKTLKVILLKLILAFLFLGGLLWLLQDFIIFPVLTIFPKPKEVIKAPEGIESFFTETSDGKKLEVWTNAPQKPKTDLVGIIFHGNGETVTNLSFVPFLTELGITAFTFDYRGYGNSNGWPSEKGLYLDAEAVWKAVSERTKVSADKVVIVGNSIGSGPAAYLAQKINPKALILLSAYYDFPSLVSQIPVYAPFRFFLRYKLPTGDYLSKLSSTCVVLAHGKRDGTIPFSHLGKLRERLSPTVKVSVIESEKAGHNDIYYAIENELIEKTRGCLGLEG